MDDIDVTAGPWVPFAGVHCVHSKETQGPAVTFKGEANFVGKADFLARTEDFIDVIDLDNSKVKIASGTLFFCGGTLDEASKFPKSLREAILRQVKSREVFKGSRIILAETAASGLAGSRFSNLLDLEEFIAALVDRVLLVVEGPGSICELGAFIKSEDIAPKLLVLVSSKHNNASSFIKVGALRYFEEKQSVDQSLSFVWDYKNNDLKISQIVLKDIVKKITESMSKVANERRFQKEKRGDRIYLTLGICYILRGAKIGEIRKCIERFGLPASESEIRNQLNVLEICGFISPENHGRDTYYVPRANAMPIQFTFKAHVPPKDTQTIRWQAEIAALIKKADPIRIVIFQGRRHAN